MWGGGALSVGSHPELNIKFAGLCSDKIFNSFDLWDKTSYTLVKKKTGNLFVKFRCTQLMYEYYVTWSEWKQCYTREILKMGKPRLHSK